MTNLNPRQAADIFRNTGLPSVSIKSHPPMAVETPACRNAWQPDTARKASRRALLGGYSSNAYKRMSFNPLQCRQNENGFTKPTEKFKAQEHTMKCLWKGEAEHVRSEVHSTFLNPVRARTVVSPSLRAQAVQAITKWR